MNGLNQLEQANAPALIERIGVLTDPIRVRLLCILEGTELTVSELCAVLQIPQSTASRHLKVLTDEGWLAARPDGTRRLYSRSSTGPTSASQAIWKLIRADTSSSPSFREDTLRLEAVLAERKSRSQEFFAGAASDWSKVRSELFGTRFDLQSLLGLLDRRWVLGDLGAGTGELARAISPFVDRVIGVDRSESMLEAARAQLKSTSNIELRLGQLENLPIEDGELDVALLSLVLHYAADPQRVLAEAARALKPGGRLLILDMNPHAHEDYRQTMGHVWLGFEPEELAALALRTGFEDPHHTHLPMAQDAKGPSLFVLTVYRSKTAPELQPTT